MGIMPFFDRIRKKAFPFEIRAANLLPTPKKGLGKSQAFSNERKYETVLRVTIDNYIC